MNRLQMPVWLLPLCAVLCLLFSGCGGGTSASSQAAGSSASSQSVQPLPPPGQDGGVTMTASFQRADGGVLSDGSVCLAAGELSQIYPLDSRGALQAPGLPREGTLWLTLFDTGGQELCRTSLLFSTGAVIDASTDQEGAGYVILKEDTEEISLIFTLSGGYLQCALRLGD